jgi:NiFe hydrogenase small subunit HydA
MRRDIHAERLPRTMSRRSFLRACAIATAIMGLPAEMIPEVARAVENPKKPKVVWLHFQECTGCSESLLRASHPDVATLILDLISLDYHETLMAAAGKQAEENLKKAIEEGNYVLVVEGAIPTKDNGIYCKIGGRTALEILKEAAEKATAIISIGTCASFGGVQSADPNPTGAKGVMDIIKDKPVINVPGCPPNPHNFLATVLYILTFNKIPPTDKYGRPLFAYGRTIHEHCPRRPHFDAGRFAEKYGDEGHKQGWCLFKLGCKGPVTYANCSVIRFNDVGAWPVGIGHPCVGCTEKGVAFFMPIKKKVDVHKVTPPDTYAPISVKQGKAPVTGIALASATLGAIVGGALVASAKLPDKEEGDDHETGR